MASDTVPAQEVENAYSNLTRNNFPDDFVFGSGTAAYQVEGGAAKGGRGLSVWDAFTLRTPGRITDGSNGNDAVDMYTRYKEDIKMMKNMGFDAYRFSISWTRILPGGRICLGVNQEGIDFYNDVINTLIAHRIEPYVTLFHWDLPYSLEQEYGGFLSKNVADDFREFAELCFWNFGDRVKYWMPLNEPWTYAVHGYVNRIFPPGKLPADHSTPDVPADSTSSSDSASEASSDSDSDSDSSSCSDSASPATSVLRTTKTLLSALPAASAHQILDLVSERAFSKTKRNFVAYRGSSSDFITMAHDPIISKLRNKTISVGSPKLKLAAIGGSHQTTSKSAKTDSSDQTTSKSAKTDSSDQSKLAQAKEAYIVAKNLLLAHAAAVQSYRAKFQEHQKGKIGIALNIHWFEPFNDKDDKDKEAAERAREFMLGWFLEPVLCGDYPESMKNYASKHIALFSKDESESLKKSKIDFVGLNYYTANYAKYDPNPDAPEGYNKDQQVEFLDEKNGKKIGKPSGATWLFIVPWGINKLLKYVDNKYANEKYNLPEIYITENGVCEKDDHRLTPYEACADKMRVNYYRDHLGIIRDTMEHMKTKVKGYFAWSWCDNFEWKDGYTYRFGINYIDYKNNFTRHPKHSATWFSKFLVRNKTLGANEKQVKEDKKNKA